MASPLTVCTACLRALSRTATGATMKSRNSIPKSSKAYSKAAATTQPLYLDFLAPSVFRRDFQSMPSFKTRPQMLAHLQHSRRALATTSDPSAAKPARAIQNPRNDDSGASMTISIAPRASNRLHKISAADSDSNLALRVSIESGGCHGFQYLMSLVDLSKEPATEEDTIFEGHQGEKVIIDESSLELLNGSTVDYTMELIGSQFKVTGIPGATSSCGCGTSFDIKL